MRPELLCPRGGGPEPDAKAVVSILTLVGGTTLEEADVGCWSPLERALVFDWAMREHLHASDNNVRRRPKPAIISLAEHAKVNEAVFAAYSDWLKE